MEVVLGTSVSIFCLFVGIAAVICLCLTHITAGRLRQQATELKAYADFLNQQAVFIRAPAINQYRATIRRAIRRIGRPSHSPAVNVLLSSARKGEAEVHRALVQKLQWEYTKRKAIKNKV